MSFISTFLGTLGLAGLSNIVTALVVFLICYVAIRLITRIVDKLLARDRKIDGTLKGFVRTALKIALWALAIVIVADTLGISTASLVTVIGVAGLALSLAVQNIAANLFSGITLLITRPFGQGDYVDIGSNSGTIKSIGLFYTVIDTVDNRVVSIPNGDVTAASIVNYSREPLRRVDMTFSASYDDSTESVREAIREAIGQDGRILSDPEPFIAVGAYKDSAVEYIVRVWCHNADYWNVYFGMNERVRESFERHGVRMTYKHLNVHVVQ